jgi:hypothetical protein
MYLIDRSGFVAEVHIVKAGDPPSLKVDINDRSSLLVGITHIGRSNAEGVIAFRHVSYFQFVFMQLDILYKVLVHFFEDIIQSKTIESDMSGYNFSLNKVYYYWND